MTSSALGLRHFTSGALLWRKLKRMTILVGMVGSDGIILAADRRMVHPAASVQELDDISGIRKIIHLPAHAVTYAAAGDEISWDAGSLISAALDDGEFDFDHIGRSLEDCGSHAFRDRRTAIETIYTDTEERQIRLGHINTDFPRGLLVVFHGSQVSSPQLWGLILQPARCFARRIEQYAIYGAIGNHARFYGKYFRNRRQFLSCNC